MNLYIISQDHNGAYDVFDAALVAAESEADAKTIHPSGSESWDRRNWCESPDRVDAVLVGKAADGVQRGVLLTKFAAG